MSTVNGHTVKAERVPLLTKAVVILAPPLLLALLAIPSATAALAGALGTDQEPEPSPTFVADETPVVDPEPLPLPLFVPCALRRVDRALPPPLVPDARGFVAVLTRSGRDACAPATHVLLVEPEGASPNSATAVIYASPRAPQINLDLYVSDFVVVSGLEDTAPDACGGVSRRLIEVRAVTVIRLPPRQSPAVSAPPGNLTSTAME